MGTDTREQYHNYFLESLSIEILNDRYPYSKEQIDEIIEIMLGSVCSKRKQICIAVDDKPFEVVKSKLMKLNSSHIEFVMDCMKYKL